MMNVDIKRPKIEDREQLYKFFKTVITDTFFKEGLGNLVNEINEEIEVKKRYLETDFASNGENRYFLIAFLGDKIIGSIEYGPANETIRNCADTGYDGLIEVGTVFVHPGHQRSGAGNLLLKAMYDALRKKGIEEFWLDSGYKRAQAIWKKKFGEPDFLLKDYWSKGYDHMIWKVKISELE